MRGKLSTSDKIDRVVTNRLLALPIFAVVMFIVYFLSVTTVGTWATDWANDGVFGDGWHLFGIGSAAYEEAAEEYAGSRRDGRGLRSRPPKKRGVRSGSRPPTLTSHCRCCMTMRAT